MAQKDPPFPPSREGAEKPSTGDERAEFERLSRTNPRPVEAERVFLQNRIALIENDLQLSDAEKQQAMAAIRRRLAVL